MELKGIKDFLDKYKSTLFHADFKRDEIINCIKNISGVQLQNSEFILKKSVITLKTTPVKKNQIFLYKDKIINELSTIKNNSIFFIN